MTDTLDNFGDLPAVAGRRLTTSIREHVRRLLVLIDDEQRRTPNPDTTLISVLCDAVRFAREHVDTVREYLGVKQADVVVAEEPWDVVTDSESREDVSAALAISDALAKPIYDDIKTKLPPGTHFAVLIAVPAVDDSGGRIMAFSTNRKHMAGLSAEWALNVLGRRS